MVCKCYFICYSHFKVTKNNSTEIIKPSVWHGLDKAYKLQFLKIVYYVYIYLLKTVSTEFKRFLLTNIEIFVKIFWKWIETNFHCFRKEN